MALKFSASILPDEPLSEVIRLVKLCEKYGFGLAWFADSQMLWRDCYVAMTVAALNTTTIKMGPGVANPLTRHPTVTAMAAMTLDDIAPGRVVIGYGQGDSSVRNLGLHPVPLKTMREAITMMKAMTAGQSVIFKDKSIKLERKHDIPIYMAGTGPKTLQLAGELADGVLINVGVEDKLLRYGIDNVRKGAMDSGRDPSKVDMACWTACSISPDRQSAYDDVKPYASWFPHSAPLPPELVPYSVSDKEKFEVYDYRSHMGRDSPQARVATQELVDTFTLAGNFADCLNQIESIAQKGIGHIAMLLLGKDKEYVIRTFGEKIIPQFS